MPSDEKDLRISQNTLRVLIGILGITMPLILVLGAWALNLSVSDYYYSNMRDYFEGVLFFLAVFLFAYHPYGQDGWADTLITSIGAVFALLIVLFPTINETLHHTPQFLVLQFVPRKWSGNLHNIGSGGLFVSFAVLALFYFTKNKGGRMTRRKIFRNGIYIACGVGILACIGWIGIGAWTSPSQTARDHLNIFWPEAIALVLFGFAWLIKGGVMLGERREQRA